MGVKVGTKVFGQDLFLLLRWPVGLVILLLDTTMLFFVALNRVYVLPQIATITTVSTAST